MWIFVNLKLQWSCRFWPIPICPLRRVLCLASAGIWYRSENPQIWEKDIISWDGRKIASSSPQKSTCCQKSETLRIIQAAIDWQIGSSSSLMKLAQPLIAASTAHGTGSRGRLPDWGLWELVMLHGGPSFPAALRVDGWQVIYPLARVCSIFLNVCVYIYMILLFVFVCLFIYLFICVFIYHTHIYLSIYRSIDRSIYLSIYLSIYSFNIYIYVDLVEGSLEAKLPTIWTDEKQSREEAERRDRSEEKRSEERRCRCAKR